VVAARRERLAAETESLLPRLLKAEGDTQKKLYDARLKELADDRGEAGRARLRRQIEKLEAEERQLTFDQDRRYELEERLRRERERLEGEEYRRVEERRERLRERIGRERDRLLSEVLPQRYVLAHADLMPVGLALAVPPGSMA
jgi:hypothetical protein